MQSFQNNLSFVAILNFVNLCEVSNTDGNDRNIAVPDDDGAELRRMV